MSLLKYCEGCKWNNGCFNTTCRMCYCGSRHEYPTTAKFQQEQVIKRNDALDSLIYATTARGNGKSSYLYEKMKQAVEDGAKICMVRKNGLTEAKRYMEEVYAMFDINAIWAPEIKNVIFNDPATIVFWSDDTKTVVKAHNEEFDPEKGLAMAICKKVLGNKGNFNNLFKKWIPEKERTVVDRNLSININEGSVNFNASIVRDNKELLDKLLNNKSVPSSMEFVKDDDSDPFEE